MVDFVFSYEHKARELESLILLKLELERRGYTVALFGSYEKDITKVLQGKHFTPKVVVTSALYQPGTLSYFSTNLFGFVKKVANLQWEQVLVSGYESKPGWKISGFVKNAVHFCWGDKVKERLITYGVPKDRAVTVGNISLDLTRPEFRSFIMKRGELAKQFDLEEDKEWVLFVSSFTLVDCDSLVIQGYVNAVGKDLVQKDVEISMKSRQEILGWFDRILEQFPDKILIYRPHPNEVVNESEPLLRKLKEKYPNFRIIKDYAIKHWVANCDIIYNWMSTSMIDILQLNNNWHLLRPIEIPLELDYKFMASLPSLSTYEAFSKSYGNKSFRSDDEKNINKKIVEDYYDNLKSKTPAYIQVADTLEAILKNDKYNIHYPLLYILSCKFNYLRKYVSSFIYQHRNIFAFLSPFLGQKWKANDHMIEYLARGYASNVATVDEIKSLEEKLRPVVRSRK